MKHCERSSVCFLIFCVFPHLSMPAESELRCCSSADCSVLLWHPSFPANHKKNHVEQKLICDPDACVCKNQSPTLGFQRR